MLRNIFNMNNQKELDQLHALTFRARYHAPSCTLTFYDSATGIQQHKTFDNLTAAVDFLKTRPARYRLVIVRRRDRLWDNTIPIYRTVQPTIIKTKACYLVEPETCTVDQNVRISPATLDWVRIVEKHVSDDRIVFKIQPLNDAMIAEGECRVVHFMRVHMGGKPQFILVKIDPAISLN